MGVLQVHYQVTERQIVWRCDRQIAHYQPWAIPARLFLNAPELYGNRVPFIHAVQFYHIRVSPVWGKPTAELEHGHIGKDIVIKEATEAI